MARRERSPEERQQASEVLFYEVTMLHDLSCRMNSLLKGNTIVGTALLEAFSVHTRALFDFLYSENPKPEDVIAEDFFPSPEEWNSIRPPKSELLNLVGQRIGTEIARLSYLRPEVVPVLKGCDYCKIATELRHAFMRFVQAVPVKSLGPHCAEFKHRDFIDEAD